MSTKTKTFLTVGAFVLAALTCLMAVCNTFNLDLGGIFGKKELNEDNLINYKDHYIENLSKESSKGLKMKWNDDGSFVLSGKHSDSDLADTQIYSYGFATITLDPGTYTLCANNKDAEKDTFGLYAEIQGNKLLTEKEGSVTFDVTDSTSVIIGFYVKNNYRLIWEKLCPTLVAGTDSIDFYK